MTQTAMSLTTDARTAIADALNQCVAETVVTTMMAQDFHWNVEGMAFGSLHALFQTIYEDHFVGQDDLAERVKALDMRAEGQLSGMLKRSKVNEHVPTTDAREMVRRLMEAEEILGSTLAGTSQLAAENGDTLTEDLAIERGRTHEKFAWMLRAHLKE